MQRIIEIYLDKLKAQTITKRCKFNYINITIKKLDNFNIRIES